MFMKLDQQMTRRVYNSSLLRGSLLWRAVSAAQAPSGTARMTMLLDGSDSLIMGAGAFPQRSIEARRRKELRLRTEVAVES
jgi:hypothetical protein